MRGLKISKQARQEKNIKDATQMVNMRPVFKTSSSGRDIPLAPTPNPTSPKVASKKKVAEGVVISRKDELNHPEDFAYLKNRR